MNPPGPASAADRLLKDGFLAGEGVDLDLVRRFACAAAEFHRASPWMLLHRGDWIRIESPVAAPKLSWVEVLGASHPYEGLAFRETVDPSPWACPLHEEPEEPEEEWLILFGSAAKMWPADAALWERAGLEVAGPRAYPSLEHIFPDARVGPADAATLRFLTGLLLALTRSSESEIDSGRWTKTIETDAGEMAFVLSIPDLLLPIEAGAAEASGLPSHSSRLEERVAAHLFRQLGQRAFETPDEMSNCVREALAGARLPYVPARTPFEAAQDLVYEAYEARGHRRRIQIARRALETSDECADAFVLLAEESPDAEVARSLYAEAVSRSRPPADAFRAELPEAALWPVTSLRPLLRGLVGQGNMCRVLEDHVAAVACFEESLRLDPDDHLYARIALAGSLYMLGRGGEALAALGQAAGKDGPFLLYLRALVTFQKQSDTPEARRLLKEAVRANEFLPPLLAGVRAGGGAPGTHGRVDEDEAFHCSMELEPLFAATPGAREWLLVHARRGPARRKPATRGAPARRHKKRR